MDVCPALGCDYIQNVITTITNYFSKYCTSIPLLFEGFS